MPADNLIFDQPLEPDLAQFREGMRRFLHGAWWRSKARDSLDTRAACWTPGDWRKACGDMRIAALAIPEERGGEGFGLRESAVVAGELGYALVGLPWLATVGLATPALLECATDKTASNMLGLVAEGAVTATLAGLDRALGRRGGIPIARTDGSAASLLGRCRGVLDATTADRILVLCQDDAIPTPSVVLVAVDRHAPGLTVTPRNAMDASRPLGDIDLEGAQGRILGESRMPQIVRIWESASLLLAHEMLGCAQHCIELTVAYVKLRRQFGQCIAQFQAVQHRCADMYVKLDAARATATYAIDAVLAGSDDRAQAVAAAKLLANDAARFAVEETIQLHGGIGFTWDHDAHLYFRRVKSSALLLGDDAFLQQRIGEALGISI